MSMRDRIDRRLDQIPGYAGYRDKERRRDSDRAVRDKLAADYGQLADRLGRLATTLANERKIDAITTVDRPLQRLRSFIDRVRTASYGYAPIFANDEVDESVLDQIRAFDAALADQLPTIERQIATLESADPSTDALGTAAKELEASIQALSDRFDKRNEIIHAGRPLPEKDLLILLESPEPGEPPVVWRLQTGDAVSYDGENYSIIGRVTAQMADGARRAYQLRGGDDRQWLEASDTHGGPLYWLKEVPLEVGGQSRTVTVGDSTYTLQRESHARGEVEGRQGSGEQSLRYLEFAAGDRVLHIFDWGTQKLTLEGVAIHDRDVELYTGQR